MKDWIIGILTSVFGVNWKTNVNGWLLAACGGEAAADAFNIVHMLPPEWKVKLQAVCFLLMAFGLFAAKDNNVTNSIVPDVPKKVPANPVQP